MSYRWLNETLQSWGAGWWWSPTGPAVLRDREQYPKTWLHEGVNGRGWPILPPGSLTTTAQVVEKFARFQHWSVSPIDLYDLARDTPVGTEETNAFGEVRFLNPRVKILAHVLGPKVWPCVTNSWAGRVWADLGPHLCRTQAGEPWENYARLDLLEVQDALVAHYLELLDSGYFDGLVLDWFAPSDTWIYAGNATLDLTPWGDLRHWDAAMTEGKRQIVERLRAARPKALLIGNGGARGNYSHAFNGWIRENFPNQNGGTFTSNVTGPLGLVSDSSFYAGSPKVSPLALALPAQDQNAMRYALGCSCLGQGALIVGTGDFDASVREFEWWIPEYSMDRATGAPLDGPATPWMGSPTCDAREVAPGVWFREFVFATLTVDTNAQTAQFKVRG